MKKISYLILLLSIISYSQVYNNDLEVLNLKGNVKSLYYDRINLHHYEIFDDMNFPHIDNNYFIYFNKDKELISYGSTTKYDKSILLMTPEKLKKIENAKQTFNENNLLTFEYNMYEEGFYKNYIKEIMFYEYKHEYSDNSNFLFSVTSYKSVIDILDIGYYHLNSSPEKFNEKEHTRYYPPSKAYVKSYNQKKQLIKIIFYDYTLRNDIEHDFYDDVLDIIFFQYNENGDVSRRIEGKGCNKKIENYTYEYDAFNNWIKKTITTNTDNNSKEVINRKIVYY